MYPWNEPDSGANHDQDQTAAVRLPAPRDGAADFTKAIQFALDRRDNGGDAVPASPPATPPTATLTRQ
jgi:hypothetical protein